MANMMMRHQIPIKSRAVQFLSSKSQRRAKWRPKERNKIWTRNILKLTKRIIWGMILMMDPKVYEEHG